MTDHYSFQKPLKSIWEKAVRLYQEDNRDPNAYFNKKETAFLKSIGHTAREVYDFAEDQVHSGEPDWETFLAIAAVRRHYYLNVMGKKKGTRIYDTENLPPKTASVRRIKWLPRIIPKARAKLRGEMSDDLMYCCGGDRNFFKTHNIHPAEFLLIVMQNFDDDQAIIDFVASRSKTAAHK